MTHGAREVSPSGIYHVVLKGCADQLIFEDDDDRLYFLNLMRDRMRSNAVSIHAWCLMSNHVHLLLDDPESNLFHAMHGLETAYAMRFNSKSGRKGPVFNERYKSFPIVDDSQFLCCVRYIHNNPIKAGIATAQMYAWSSFRDYMSNIFGVTDTRLVLDMLGGVEGFYKDSTSSAPNPYFFRDGAYIDDLDALEVARAVLYPYEPHELKTLQKAIRDPLLCKLKDLRFTIAQITRITGVGRNTVQRAKPD